MKAVLLLLPIILLPATAAAGISIDGFHHVSPSPDARFVPRETTILLRPKAAAPAVPSSMDVTGSISGKHDGKWTVADQGRALVFRPANPFAAGEEVRVTVARPGNAAPATFHFTISPKLAEPTPPAKNACTTHAGPAAPKRRVPERSASGTTGFPWPSDFPGFAITVNDAPSTGHIFAGPRLTFRGPPHFAMMMDNTGAPAFLRRLPSIAGDFKKQRHVPNRYSYLQGDENNFHLVDENLDSVDEFGPENGYFVIDGHDFQVLPNGNVLIGILDYQPVDMSLVVPGGDPNAIVAAFVLQEQDPAHNVVFQWRSLDHFAITEAVGIDFTGSWIDYVHFNSFDLDTDGNVLISFREMNEMTKIDRQTGAVLWRFGGGQNEFTLVGDTQWFERQHSIRRTDTGTVTVFDNGALAAPWESRAVEYSIDEVNKVATMVWEFRDSPPKFSGWGSSVQRLPNGNTMIDWAPLGTVTEVQSDGTKVFEMVFDEHWTYRAPRFAWDGVASRPELWHDATTTLATLHFTKFGDANVGSYNVYRDSTPLPTTLVGSTAGNSFDLSVTPLEVLYVRVTAVDTTGAVESAFSNELEITVPSAVAVPVLPAPESGVALWASRPNPFGSSTRIPFVLPRAGAVELAVYNVHGRRVRTLAAGEHPAGTHALVWDGRDGSGLDVGPGVYFVRLDSAEGAATRKVLRVK